jgi:cytochrome c553
MTAIAKKYESIKVQVWRKALRYVARYNREVILEDPMKLNKTMRLLAGTVCLVALTTVPTAGAQAVTANPDAARDKSAMCLGCHNIANWRASFPETHKVPLIAGQGAKYIESALKAYRKGDRKHPTMRAIAEALTDQDIADLAAYYERAGVQGVK